VSYLDVVRAELDQHEIDYTLKRTGSGHQKLTFPVKDRSKDLTMILAYSPSDHRAPLNARARIRRYLRDGGYDLKPEAKVQIKRPSKDKLVIETEPEKYYTKAEVDVLLETHQVIHEILRAELDSLKEHVDALSSLIVTPKRTPIVPILTLKRRLKV
jgi:hypothetical protein